jgi:uncharacterized protein (TIGR01777 family)
MKAKHNIVLAGGSGFLGQMLATHFAKQNRVVVVLTRSPSKGDRQIKEVYWDGQTLGEWVAELNGAMGVVNLAGRSVNCRYHARNRQAIQESRVRTTRLLGNAIAQCAQPPCVWLNSSTATIYRHSLDQAMDEETGEIGATPEAKDAFSVEVARAWEQALTDARTPATRKLALRTAMVLGPGEGGVFRVLRRLVRLGLGGRMASGRQFVSWIHEDDFCRAIDWLVEREDLSGPVNLAAPGAVTNSEMMRALRRVCGMRIGLPATRWMLEVGACLLRTETELIIKSRRVTPARLLASGFDFRFPKLEEALLDLERRVS